MTTMMNNTGFRDQARKALRRLDAAKPHILDDNNGNCRMSRRIPGIWTTSGDRHGYRHAYCYIEKGLEDRFDMVASVLTLVLEYLARNCSSECKLFLASFGGENDDIRHHPVAMSIRDVNNAGIMAKILCSLSGRESLKENSPSVFKTFFPNLAINNTHMGPPSTDDVVIIFKNPVDMLMKKGARNSYLRRLMRHAVWVTANPDGSATVEKGTYLPGEWMENEISLKAI